MDVRDDEPRGAPRNGMNGGGIHRNVNAPLAAQIISEAEAQRMRSGFPHRHAPENTSIEDHDSAPKFHDSGEVGKAPNMYAGNPNSYR
ncbi:MAG TPA: hypothetical protein VK543_02765 [Puia sp.]|nr:hypothetical protein [Puia sp.]